MDPNTERFFYGAVVGFVAGLLGWAIIVHALVT